MNIKSFLLWETITKDSRRENHVRRLFFGNLSLTVESILWSLSTPHYQNICDVVRTLHQVHGSDTQRLKEEDIKSRKYGYIDGC